MQRFHIHRFEFKYLLNQKQYNAIKEELFNYAVYDPYSLRSADKSYMVYSLYYDTPSYNAFWEKIDGVRNRSKFRFRAYDTNTLNEPDVYLEIKRRKNSVILKDRAKLDFKNYLSCLNGNLPSLLNSPKMPQDQKKVLEELVYNALRFNLCPAVLISYKREAFFGKYHNNTRITFDSGIKSYKTENLFSPYKVPVTVLSSDFIVFELKFNGNLPHWVHHLIQKYDLMRESHSKYCHSMIETYGITI